MNIHHQSLVSSNTLINPPRQGFQHLDTKCFIKLRIRFGSGYGLRQKSNLLEAKKNKFVVLGLKDFEKDSVKVVSTKKGSVAGAVALIIGTSIGSGILALPMRTSPAGLLPSSISLTVCWAFLLIEALLLVEINIGLRRKKEMKEDDPDKLEILSIRTMAQETLGEWGGALAAVTYLFFGYSSIIAYCSKSGEILHRMTGFPESVSGVLFALLFTVLVSVGGTKATDQVNRWLTVSMIGLLVSIEVVAVVFGGWSGFQLSTGDWGRVPETLPVMVFALVYHDLVPVLCAYLDNDLLRLQASVLLGSVVPLLALLIWEAITLGLFSQADHVSDPIELLLNVSWDGIPFMVEVFSLLAVGTSLIGTLLSFSEFLKEQLNNVSDIPEGSINSSYYKYIGNWWEKNKDNLTATAMVIAPSLVVSTAVPDAFSAATDIAGGYCMAILYGILPPAMAWTMNGKKQGRESDKIAISRAKPALVAVGLLASGIVVEQVLQDFSLLHP